MFPDTLGELLSLQWPNPMRPLSEVESSRPALAVNMAQLRVQNFVQFNAAVSTNAAQRIACLQTAALWCLNSAMKVPKYSIGTVPRGCVVDESYHLDVPLRTLRPPNIAAI